MIEDLKGGLVLAGPEKVFTQAGAAADHLPELGVGFHRLGEDQVDDLRDIDASVQHVHGNCYSEILASVSGFEIVNELFGARLVVVDAQAEVAAILGIHFIEELDEKFGVAVVAGENDSFAKPGAVGVADAFFHQIPQDGAVGVLVEDGFADLLLVIIDVFRISGLFGELLALLRGEILVFDAIPQKLGGVLHHGERGEVGRLVADRLVVGIVRGGVFVFAAEQLISITEYKLYRSGGEADLIAVEPAEDVAEAVVDAAVRFVGHDEIEEADVEVLIALHHRRVGGEVDALFLIVRRVAGDDDAGLRREKFVEGFAGLFAEFAAVAEEEDAFSPLRTDHELRDGDGDAGLAGASGLDQKGVAAALVEVLTGAFDALDLIEPVDDGLLRKQCAKAFFTLVSLEDAIPQAVQGIEAEDGTGRLALGIVPNEDLVAVRVEDDRPLAVFFFQTVGVVFRLHLAFGCVFGGFLAFENSERKSVVRIP